MAKNLYTQAEQHILEIFAPFVAQVHADRLPVLTAIPQQVHNNAVSTSKLSQRRQFQLSAS